MAQSETRSAGCVITAVGWRRGSGGGGSGGRVGGDRLHHLRPAALLISTHNSGGVKQQSGACRVETKSRTDASDRVAAETEEEASGADGDRFETLQGLIATLAGGLC